MIYTVIPCHPATTIWDLSNPAEWQDPTIPMKPGLYLLRNNMVDASGHMMTETTAIEITDAPPYCSITYSPALPEKGDPVLFDSHAGEPGNPGAIGFTCGWNFGDGGAGSGLSATHSYDSVGTFIVTATVTDDEGTSGSCLAMVTMISTHEVNLPAAGWWMIAQPHQGDHALRDADPQVMVSAPGFPPVPFCDAFLMGLVESPLYTYEYGGYVSAGCDPWDEQMLRQGRGYWIMTKMPGVTLIFP